MKYDDMPNRGKATSDGEPTAKCSRFSRCSVIYQEDKLYQVFSEKYGVVWSTIANSMDQAIRRWNTMQFEKRMIRNAMNYMSKAHIKRTQNWVIVQRILMQGTSTAGMTSSVTKCRELGFDPYGYGMLEIIGSIHDKEGVELP